MARAIPSFIVLAGVLLPSLCVGGGTVSLAEIDKRHRCHSWCNPRPTGATRRSGASGPTTRTACSTRRAASRLPRPMLDPKTMKYSFIDTCFGTHHLQFGYDADDTLWLSGTGLPIRRKETPRDCSGVAQDTPQRLRGRSVVGFIPLFLKSGVSRKWVFMNRN